MHRKDIYPYCEENLLENPCHYHYTSYQGKVLIRAWQENRIHVRTDLKAADTGDDNAKMLPSEVLPGHTHTGELLQNLLDKFSLKQIDETDFDIIKKLLQKFEVSKKVYTSYSQKFKPAENANASDLRNYIMLARIFSQAYEQTEKLYYLNALLKILDLLSSVYSQLPSELHEEIVSLFEREQHFINELSSKQGISL